MRAAEQSAIDAGASVETLMLVIDTKTDEQVQIRSIDAVLRRGAHNLF